MGEGKMQLKRCVRNRLISLTAIAGSAIFSGSVMATDFIVPIDIDMPNVVALAVGVYPDYEGSDDDSFGALPAISLQFDERYIRLLGPYLEINMINSEVFRFGPTAMYRFGRDDDIDDAVVKLVHEVDDAFELGAFAGFNILDKANPRIRYGASVNYLQDVTDEHDGYTLQVSARGWYPVSKPIDLGISAGWTYASDDYMSSYFGVTAADNASSGLAIFSAGSGSKDVYIQPMMMIHFSESWHVGIGVRVKSMLGDAEDSPVVDVQGETTQVIAGVGVAYTW
jgi:outer membrane protein